MIPRIGSRFEPEGRRFAKSPAAAQRLPAALKPLKRFPVGAVSW